MSLKFRKKVIVAKIESTYGTDSAPTGAANAIQTSNFQITPLEAEYIERNLDRPTLGNELQILVGTHVMVSFDVEMAGAGAVDTAPAYGPLLRGCGTAETITAITSVAYAPISASEESVTIYAHLDGQKHALVGARGSASLSIRPRGIAQWSFQFTGLWVDPATASDPTPDYSAFQTPLPITNDNTGTFTLHGSSYNVLGFSFNQNNQVTYRNVVGEESVQITDRNPTGSITIEAPVLSTKNWFTTIKAGTTGAMQVIHGSSAGAICQFDGSTVQATNPQYGESDGIRTLSMDLSFIPSDSGDDEFTFTTK